MFLQQLGVMVIEIRIHEHHVHVTWYQGAEYLKRSRGVQNLNKDVRCHDVLKRKPLCNSARQAHHQVKHGEHGLADTIRPDYCRVVFSEVREKRIHAKVLKNFYHSTGPAAAKQAGKKGNFTFLQWDSKPFRQFA